MADEEHLEILKQGVEIWNTWREDNPEIRPDLSGADLFGANLKWADFSGAVLGGTDFGEADLSEANLTGADLGRAKLSWANLSATNLSWADLSEADLSAANLGAATLTGALLTEANLSEANLSWTEFNEADLVEADLSRADLSAADLSAADLSRANLSGANLSRATLFGTILKHANLNKSIFAWTSLDNLNLTEVEGLQSTFHDGPSSIGLDTIYNSQGRIPEAFLRKAGVPDNFIEYMPHLMGDAIQFYSCFISYSSKDQAFADRLHSDLQMNGVRCWFAPEDIRGGRKLYEQIPEAIRLYDKLLLVLSENSMNSEWVKTEIHHAGQDEIRTGKRKLFPIGLADYGEICRWEAFDADVGKDMAREVREYYIPDFSDWKNHDSYVMALGRLLRDLQAED